MKKRKSDDTRIEEIRARYRDMKGCHGETIKTNGFVHMPVRLVVGDMEFLLGIIDRDPAEAETESELVEA